MSSSRVHLAVRRSVCVDQGTRNWEFGPTNTRGRAVDSECSVAQTGWSGFTGRMPLTGEYEPSPSKWAADQAELIESSNGAEGTTLNGMPVVLLTTRGAKSGKLRKTPLMRVEHDGKYAIVASLGGAPKNPVWYYNVKADPHVELRDGRTTRDMVAREVTGE